MKILNQFPQRSETFHLKSVWRDPVHHQSIQGDYVKPSCEVKVDAFLMFSALYC